MDFCLLGPLEVRADGRPLPLGGRKQRGILGLLLLHANEVVSTDRLIDELWGARPPRTVDAYVQNCVSRLRAVLGSDAIATAAPGYRICVRPDDVDSLRFRRAVGACAALDAAERAAALREALDLWRGPPLADLQLEGDAAIEVARLEELRLDALEQRIAAELELGWHDAVQDEIGALAAHHPTREGLRRLQMLALYRAGRQRDALRAYQDARLELVQEHGLEPGPDLRALERMIITHDVALDLKPDEAPPRTSHVARRGIGLAGSVDATLADGRDALSETMIDISAAITENGGVVTRLDDVVEAVFGADRVRDDDAVRALRAAYALRSAVDVSVAIEQIGEDGANAARSLLDVAGKGELVVGPRALALAAGTVDVVRRPGSSPAYRVLRFDERADPFVRHPDVSLVGRDAELRRVDDELRRAAEAGVARRVVFVGDPGIGKTRLARALAARQRRSFATRCTAYGESAGLEPFTDLVTQAGRLERILADDADRARVTALLRDAAGAEQPDRFWAMRRLLEGSAREAPVLVVLDDLHAASAAFLDLVDYLTGWCDAPVVIVCLARPELLEARPEWGRDAAEIASLSLEETAELAARLPEAARLLPEQIDRAARAAEGNPLYLEQLLASGGGVEGVPPTIEVLITSRLDRLAEVERAVIDGASVVGRDFWRSAVEAALPDLARADIDAALRSLVRSRLVLPERSALTGEDGFRFHHALIRDVAYESLPADARARLHEAVARSLGDRSDELVGFHYERAVQLGAEDRRLAAEAATHLGRAGLRAMKAVQGGLAVDLLTRAVALTPPGPRRLELDWALATALKFAGEVDRADELLTAVERHAGDAAVAARARTELVWRQLERGQLTASEAIGRLRADQVICEEAGDELGLARALHLEVAVAAVFRLRFGGGEHVAPRVQDLYRRTGFVHAAADTMLAAGAYRGPTRVPDALQLCDALLDSSPAPVWESFVLPFRAALRSMIGQVDAARRDLEDARARRQEFSDAGTIATSWAALAADVELHADEPARAVSILEDACTTLRAAGAGEWLATNTAMLAEALYRVGRLDEASAAAHEALGVAPPGHLTSRVVAERVRARVLAQQGNAEDALRLIDAVLADLGASDALDELGQTFAARAEIVALTGGDASADTASAAEYFSRKGDLSGERRLAALAGASRGRS